MTDPNIVRALDNLVFEVRELIKVTGHTSFDVSLKDIETPLASLADFVDAEDGEIDKLVKAAETIARTISHDTDTGDEVSIVAKIDMLVAMLGGDEEDAPAPAIVRIAHAVDRGVSALERLAAVAERLAPALEGLSFEVEATPVEAANATGVIANPDGPLKAIGSEGSWAQKQLEADNKAAAMKAIAENPISAADKAVIENLAHEAERSQNNGETKAEKAMRESADKTPKTTERRMGRHPARRART